MLGIGGKFAGAKGMVAVPNLSDLSPDAALTALQAVGLFRGTVGTGTTSNSGLSNKVFSQSVASGTLVDYESVISYNYYIFVAPPAPQQPPAPSPVLCGTQYWQTTSEVFDCAVGGGFSQTRRTEELRQNFCLSGVPTGQFAVFDTRSSLLGDIRQRDGVCGFTAPPVCNPRFDIVSTWTGACINGSQLWATRYRNSCTGAEHVVSGSFSCCVSVLQFVSDWAGSCINCYQQTAVRYRDSCTGVETVVNGSNYCCAAAPAPTAPAPTAPAPTAPAPPSGGPSGGGAGGQVAL